MCLNLPRTQPIFGELRQEIQEVKAVNVELFVVLTVTARSMTGHGHCLLVAWIKLNFWMSIIEPTLCANIQWLIFCFLNASILSFCQCQKNLLKVHFRYSGKSVSFMVLNISIARFMFFFHLKDNRVGLVSVRLKYKESRESVFYSRFV